MVKTLSLSDFDYRLPKELIAQYPLKLRASSRLLVLNRKSKTIEHRHFKDLTLYLKKGDVLVLNNSKVMPVRFKGKRETTGGKVEILLLKKPSNGRIPCLLKSRGRLLPGEKILLGENLSATMLDKRRIRFDPPHLREIYRWGLMPLPPYIKREPQVFDGERYQTIYAKKSGSIASPTAGLHFNKDLLERIKRKGINVVYLTLHVGYSTFKPVKEQDIGKHKMQPEYFELSSKTKTFLEQAKQRRRRIVAVGTTTVRALETMANLTDVRTKALKGYTNLFIYPPYKFKFVDSLLTNFHLPRTTLFLLVAAFAGRELIMRAYQEAIRERYRFLSYGDAMLII